MEPQVHLIFETDRDRSGESGGATSFRRDGPIAACWCVVGSGDEGGVAEHDPAPRETIENPNTMPTFAARPDDGTGLPLTT